MRITLSLAALFISGVIFAQVSSKISTLSTKQIMLDMAIPDSNALFDAGGKEKPTDQEWADFRKHALSLTEAGNLLMTPGRMATGKTKGASKSKGTNAAGWNAAAKLMADAGKAAVAAIDKKNLDALGGDVGEKILNSCSSCHDKYMIK
jgi:cytochrome c556